MKRAELGRDGASAQTVFSDSLLYLALLGLGCNIPGSYGAGRGLGLSCLLAAVNIFEALSINAYFFRLYRIMCHLKVRHRAPC